MTYPLVSFDLGAIGTNASAILSVCREHGIEPFAVIKGYNAIPEISAALVEAGYGCLASSRLHHLRIVKERMPAARTLALRIPMLSEAADLVRWADCCLCSELAAIEAVDAEARRQGTTRDVILMRDLGDLREGIWGAERFVEIACEAEKKFRRARLCGIGANLSCYGTVRPGAENMADLANCADEIERAIGRKLEVVSGGATTSLPMVARGEMPRAVNNLRIGAGLMHRSDIYGARDGEFAEVTDDTMFLEAEIIEIGEKPTHPVGELDRDCFGNFKTFEDRGEPELLRHGQAGRGKYGGPRELRRRDRAGDRAQTRNRLRRRDHITADGRAG
jgi:predicted amino acid racemase